MISNIQFNIKFLFPDFLTRQFSNIFRLYFIYYKDHILIIYSITIFINLGIFQKMTIKCIIFDLGDVIVDLDFNQFFNEVITPSPLNKPKTPIILEFFRQSDTYHQGKISDKEFYNQACELLRISDLNQKQFYIAFNSIISEINMEMVKLVKKIRKYNNFKIICLSNINSSHWKYIKKKKWDIWDLFDEFILSHEVHLTKPDSRIFEIAIQKAGCNPEDIVFIDDGLNNIRAALELGIKGIHFVDINELTISLKELNIRLN
ncbi:MAG: HAD family hydrolase [Promethearchaeota archaeon]